MIVPLTQADIDTLFEAAVLLESMGLFTEAEGVQRVAIRAREFVGVPLSMERDAAIRRLMDAAFSSWPNELVSWKREAVFKFAQDVWRAALAARAAALSVSEPVPPPGR